MNDEQVTFDGIPIPLTLETILSAMEEAHDIALKSAVLGYPLNPKHPRIRQYHAFRARILRMDAENIEQLAQAEIQERNLNKRIAEYRKEIIEKDEEIRVLEKYIKDHDYKTILDYMEKYLEGDME